MTKSGVLIMLSIFFMASCSGCFNKQSAHNDKPGADTIVQIVENDSAEVKINETSGTINDSVIKGESTPKIKKPFGQQKLEDSPAIRNTAEFHYKRGLVLFKISNYEEGIKEFDTVIKMDPKMGKAYINRGSAWMELKKYREAANDFEKAIGLSSSDSTAYLNLGLAYLYLGDFKEAADANSKLIRLTPTDAKAFFNRGFAYGQMKAFKNAIADFDQAVKINPSYHEAFFNRGLAYFFSGDKTKACSDWETAKQYGSAKAATAIEKECK